MLSKLTFTFKTKMANTYTVAVNNLRIESATTKSTGTYHKANEGTITWSTDQLSNTTGTYTSTTHRRDCPTLPNETGILQPDMRTRCSLFRRPAAR